MAHIFLHGFAFLAMGAALWLSGLCLTRFLPDLGRTRGLAAFCLGLAWWALALFALAASGFLGVGGLAAAALPLVFLAFSGRRRSARGAAAKTPRPRRAAILFGLFLTAVFLLSFFLAISPRISWDADVYHLTLPRLFLEHGGFSAVPMSVYSNWPLTTELFFAAAMLTGDYMSAKAVHFGFGLLVVYALGVGASPRRGPAAAALAAGFFLANDVVAWELHRAYVDLAHAFFFLAAFLFLHRALEEEPRRPPSRPARKGAADGAPRLRALWDVLRSVLAFPGVDPEDRDQRGAGRANAFLLLAGICAGLTAGVKVTGIVGAGLLFVLYLPRLMSSGRDFSLFFVLPVLVFWLPWLAKSAWVTGNPFYPFFFDILGGPDWSAALGAKLSAWQSSIGMGREPLDYLLLPLRVIFEGERGYDHFDGEISPFWIAVLPLGALAVRREPLVRRALAVAGLYFIFWAFTSQQMRFLIPALPLLALAGAVALHDLLDRFLRPAWRDGLACLLAAVLILTVHGGYLSGGARNALAFLHFEGDLARTVVPEHHRFINETLPEDARLLFLNTNLGFFCDREYLADSFFEASQIADRLRGADSVDEVRRRLDDWGVTHLLFDQRPRVPDFPPSLAALLNDPEQIEALFRSSDGRFYVLQLR